MVRLPDVGRDRLWILVVVTVLLWPSPSSASGGCLEPRGQWPYGPVNVVAATGDLVVYSRGATIEIADVSAPFHPNVLGATEITGYPTEIAVSGTIAFVAANDEGLFVIDFSDPTAPSVVGRWGGQTDQVVDIAASGDYAYLASNRLIVLDLSDPTDPVEVARVSDWRISQLELVGHHVYGIGTSLLAVYDVADPTAPSVVFQNALNNKSHLAVNDQRLLTTYAGRLSVYTLDDPAAPVFVTEYDDPATYFQTVAIGGTHAYIATYDDEFAIVDTTDPANPSTTAIWPAPGNPDSTAVDGSIAYLTTHEDGLRIIDVEDSSAPTEIGFIPATGASNDLAIVGDHAFVAQHGSGLRVFDVSDPGAPVSIGFVALDGALDVSVSGTRALVTGGEAGIFVIDISDPANPVLLGGRDTPHRAWKAEVVGDFAFVADGDSGLRIYDVSDPNAIFEVGALTSVDSAMDVAVVGDVAYLADCYWGFATVDVSNPSAPVKLFGDGLWDNFCADSIVVRDTLAILVEGWNLNGGSSIHIFDVSNPSIPVRITEFEQVPEAWIGADLALDGDVLYIAYERATVVFDIRNPFAPALIGRRYSPGASTGVDVAGDTVVIAASVGGIATAGCTECADAIFADGWEDSGWYFYTAWSEVVP